MDFSRNDFPEGFTFGAATAAYQIEGSKFGGAGPSHWDTFAATPGNVLGNDDGAVACDHFHRYEEDFDLVKNGGFDAYRFSTSWSRVMPDGKTVNPEGLDYYERLVDAMLERGIDPYLTLYHWELPAALSDLGGWTNRDVASWFADFTEVVIDRIGDRVAATATINEPWCVAWLSHFIGAHAPGTRDIRAAARAMHHVNLAHGASMKRMREMGQKNLGVVLNFDYAQPADSSAEAEAAAAIADATFNRWFVEAITKKEYPAETLGVLGQHMPKNWEADMDLIGGEKLDWLGVNYYTRHLHTMEGSDNGGFPNMIQVKGHRRTNSMDWEFYPEGLHHFLTWLGKNYTGDTPLFVTENGMAWSHDKVENGAVFDQERMDYFAMHLGAVRDAISDGANVQGYFAWSLLDNYEWAFGYQERFGLVHVDFDTQVRTPKASYQAFARSLNR